MARELDSTWSSEQGLPLSSPYEAVILASIIEKETGLASEEVRLEESLPEGFKKACACKLTPPLFMDWGSALMAI